MQEREIAQRVETQETRGLHAAHLELSGIKAAHHELKNLLAELDQRQGRVKQERQI